MTISYTITDKEQADIELAIANSDKTAEAWLKENLDSLVKQCSDIIKNKELEKLGELTLVEIELIKTNRIK